MQTTFYFVKTKETYIYNYEREITFGDIYPTLLQRFNLNGNKLYFIYDKKVMVNTEKLPSNATVYVCIEELNYTSNVFPYQQQLDALNNMGFHQENLRELLLQNFGDINIVIELLYDE
jgi:hypothetical protein